VSVAATKLEPTEPCAEELARLAQGGEVSAFEAVVGLFGPRLLRYIRQRVGNVHTAEDLVQETFLKAFRGLAGYDSSRPLATWLFTIATRVAISHRRRRFEITLAAPDELSGVTVSGPDEAVSQAEEYSNIWTRARRVLPEIQFVALWLKYAEEMPVSQIAEITGMSVSNVKVLLHRGRKKMAECIETENRPRAAKGPAGGKRSQAGSGEVKYVR
jgi:RNA polymerase sigma-70 factor (ECF subfamily)